MIEKLRSEGRHVTAQLEVLASAPRSPAPRAWRRRP